MAEDVEIPDIIEGSSPDAVARWVLMLSHLYYDRSVSLVDDGLYDELCQQVADNYDALSEHLQVQIGDPDVLRASGMGVLLSGYSIGGAQLLAKSQGVQLDPFEPDFDYECECCGCRLASIRG